MGFAFFIARSLSGDCVSLGHLMEMEMSNLMYPKRLQPVGLEKRYSAKNMAKPINFFCMATHAKAVSVIGDFNDWHPNAHPMKRQPDRSWHLQIPLNHGHHRYLFYVDGANVLDPRAQGVTRNEKNERVSLLAVS